MGWRCSVILAPAARPCIGREGEQIKAALSCSWRCLGSTNILRGLQESLCHQGRFTILEGLFEDVASMNPVGGLCFRRRSLRLASPTTDTWREPQAGPGVPEPGRKGVRICHMPLRAMDTLESVLQLGTPKNNTLREGGCQNRPKCPPNPPPKVRPSFCLVSV